MGVIFDILFFLSMVSIAISVILLIVKASFKKGPSFKKVVVLIASSLVVFIVSGILMPDLTPEQKAKIEDRKQEKELAAAAELEADKKEKTEEERKKEAKDKEEIESQGETKAKEVENKEQKEQADQKEELEKKKEVETKEKSETEKKSAAETNKKEKGQKSKTKKEDTVLEKSRETIYEIFKSGDDKISDTIENVEFDKSDSSLSATVKGKDGWSEKSIGKKFYEDSTTVYRELSKDKRINEVWITITFPMQDEYGNVKNEEVMGTWMSRETMDKINWKNFNNEKLLDVVDGKKIYPQFVQ